MGKKALIVADMLNKIVELNTHNTFEQTIEQHTNRIIHLESELQQLVQLLAKIIGDLYGQK